MKLYYIPNLISSLRILLVIPLAYFLLQQNYNIAFFIFVIAGVSDALDGYLARRYNWFTSLGVVLDPIGDKLLMLASYLILGVQEYIPMWLVYAVILRDVIIVLGSLFYRLLIGELEIEPILSSKINTLLQISLIIIVLFTLAIYPIKPAFIIAFMAVVFLSTLVSGGCYIFLWGKRVWERRS
ncbi:MAG: CDP-alcohol phosphatidyltransferase family protein [Gammaproteobacteria bacterium]|nr:CDP-alcohol phosphatidyltransferase family protein [Gammaproteobacteria bacterium]